MSKKNDWIAINLNSGEDVSLDSLSAYGINPDNTGLQSEDYYKSIKQVRDTFTNDKGDFDDAKFHDFYQSAKRSYNVYQQSNFTQKIIDEIESSPYDIFSLGTKVMDTSAAIYRSKDPQRTTMGLGNLFEVGSPTFDIREVAQANKARDEEGNVLDWSPNDKGGFLKGLFRPTMVLATYDEDGSHIENGVEVYHRKGDLKLDEFGDPYYEKLGNREIYGKETLHYWDTITRDDSAWNKIDFMDSDGLTKSVGGTVMRTAFSLLPYFTPIGPYLGYVGAAIALGQTLPVLSKGLDGIITGSTDNAFGRSMSSLEAIMERFGHSQSRDAMGRFFSAENIGDIVASSASQLFQQRMIAQLPKKFAKSKDVLAASKFGRELALGYMIATSANDSYSIFKEAGATDRMAGIGLLGVTSGLALLMNNNYFKDMWFTGTFMDEDIAMRDTMKQLIKESTVEPFAEYASLVPKATSKYQQKLANTWLYKKIEKNIVNKVKPVFEKFGETRPTVGMLERAIATEGEKSVGLGMKASLYLNRALNEGLEESMEEGVTDAMKLITMGLDALGVKVSNPDQELDFGLTLRDAVYRYGSSFLGGAIGGTVFEGFNQFEGGSYDSLLEKSLTERLVWYERNGYDKEIRDRVKRLYEQGKLGNVNLSSKGSRIKSADGKEMVVYGQGDENDNQNLFTYNVINSYLDRLSAALDNEGLFSDNKIYNEILKSVRERRNNDDSDPEVKLYHFLQDINTAKALTITQMGFLNAVKEDADKLSFAILKKSDEIEQTKKKLRADNHITDSDSSKEAEVFKNSLMLKVLENELKEMREAWDAILKGERNGYYMGYAQMMTSPRYSDYYTNPNSIVNQQEAFPKTSIDNWSKYNYGIEYSKVTEEELKKKIEDDWNAFNNLMDSSETGTEAQINLWRAKSRALYDTHIKFSEKFAPDILKLADEVKGKSTINLLQFLQNEFKNFSETSESLIVKNAYSRFAEEMEAANKESDSEKRQNLKSQALENFIINGFSGDNSYTSKLQLLKHLNDAKISGNFIGLDFSDIRKALAVSITTPVRTAIVNKELSPILNDLFGNFLITQADEIANMSSETIQKIIDSLSDDERSMINNLDYYIEGSNGIEDIAEELVSVLQSRRPLLSGESSVRGELNIKINDLLDAIDTGSSEIANKYEQLIQFILDNSKSYGEWDKEFTRNDAIKLIDSIIGEDVVKTFIEEQVKEASSSYNPLVTFLKNFDAFAGGKIFNVIDVITKEEAFRNALKNENEYKVTSKTREEELKTALSFLNIIAAVIDSSMDGLNEFVNLSNPDIKLAVIDPESTRAIGSLLNQIIARINILLNVSNQNKRKTTRAQQETMINVNRKRVENLVNIGEIDFGGSKINFEEEWNKENYSLNDATLEKSKSFDQAFRNFQSRISKRLQEIANEKKSNLKDEFIKPLVDKFGLDVYLQQTGELTNDEDVVIPPYSQVLYLLTITELNADKFNSIWKSITIKNPELIPIFGQEYLVRENLASMISTKSGYDLFYVLHTYIKENFPEKQSDGSEWKTTAYIKGRDVLRNFINTDGIGGTGKTFGVDYLTNEASKLYYSGNVSAIALGGTPEAAVGVHSALKLGTDSTKAMSFDEFMKTICTDDSGKVLFDYESGQYFIKPDSKKKIFNAKLKKDASGNIVDGKGNTLAKINVKKLEELFTTKDGLRVMYFDETGLINSAQVLLLHEIAKLHNFFICGSGDTLQNKATYGGENASSGIEDFVYHRTPALTISMRSENNGIYRNVETIKILLRETQTKIYGKDPSSDSDDFDKEIGDKINELKLGGTTIKLIYSDTTLAGHRFIHYSDVITIGNKMLEQIDKLKESDPNTKHQLAIVAPLDKQNNYKEQFKDRVESGDVVIIDPVSVQGREYDFVIAAKDYNSKSKFINIQDFYTMMTRAKRGAAIVDEKNVIKDYGLDSVSDETASETVAGSTPEEKAELFKEYISWRMSLMEDIPEFTDTGTPPPPPPPPTPPTPSPKPGKTPVGAETIPPDVTEVVIAGTEEEFHPENLTQDEITEHYKEELKKKGGFHANSLVEREKLSKSSTITIADSDLLIGELKDFDSETNSYKNTSFEDSPLSIARWTSDMSTNEKVTAHRIIIATVARAILNNKSDDGRKQYIHDAADYLEAQLNLLPGVSGFVSGLQRSFEEGDQHGFFFYDKNYIYYSFETDNGQCAIPIMKHRRPDLNGSIFENLQFEIKVGSIPISSNGEIMSPAHSKVSEIEGIICGERNTPQISVQTISSTLRQELDKQFKADGEESLRNTVRRAIRFMFENRGKAFIALNAASSSFKKGNDFFKMLLDDGDNIIGGVNQRYDGDIQDAALVGLQQITSLTDWFNIIGILTDYARKKNSENRDSELSAFFNLPETRISEEFNNVSEDSEAIAKNYKLLGKYSILNHSAIDKLTSAIFRYLTINPDTKWRDQYLQGFTQWLRRVRTNDNNDVHKRGFSVRFQTKGEDGLTVIHQFTVSPNVVKQATDKSPEVVGYSILYSSSTNPAFKSIYSTVDETPWSLFENTKFDFISSIFNILNKSSQQVSFLQSFTSEKINSLIQSGDLIVYPVDLMYSAEQAGQDTGLPQRVYSAYESDVYTWMTNNGKPDSYEITNQDLNDLEEFLRNDTVFKHNLYRDIKVEHDDSSDTKSWGSTKGVSLTNSYVDIVKIIAPLYELLTSEAITKDSERYETLKSKLQGFFETTEELESDEAAIRYEPGFLNFDSKTGILEFMDNHPIINSAWLKENSNWSGTENQIFEVVGYIPFTSELILNNGQKVQLNLSGRNNFINVDSFDQLRDIVKKNTIVSEDKETIIVGNSIHFGDGTIYNNIELIGISGNNYYFSNGKASFSIKLSNEESGKLNKRLVESIKDRGTYVGVLEDSFSKNIWGLYLNGTNINRIDLSPDGEISEPIDIASLQFTENGVLIDGIEVTDSKIVDTLKTIVNRTTVPSFKNLTGTTVKNSDMIIVSGAHNISSDQMRLLVVNPEVIEGETYHILAYDRSRIGYYTGNDLSTFRWGDINNFDSSEIKIDFKYEVVDVDNPAITIQQNLEEIKNAAIDEFIDPESTASEFYYTVLENGEFIRKKETDYILDGVSVKSRRAITRYIKSLNSDISDLVIYKEEGKENHPIIFARYNVNGQSRVLTGVVDPKGNFIPKANNVVSIFDSAKSKFENSLQQLDSKFKSITEAANSSTLTPEQSSALLSERNELAEILAALNVIKKEISSGEPNSKRISQSLSALTEEYKNVAIEFYKAFKNQKEC